MAKWIQLRRGLPGLGGPFLVEYRSAYQVFDDSTSPPRLIVAIGGYEKRRFLHHALHSPIQTNEGIALRPLSSSTIVADCDLQDLCELQPIEHKQATSERNHHTLEHFPPQMQQVSIIELAQELYWQVLAP